MRNPDGIIRVVFSDTAPQATEDIIQLLSQVDADGKTSKQVITKYWKAESDLKGAPCLFPSVSCDCLLPPATL